MAVVTGLTPTSQEVRGSPAVSQGWNWLRRPCNPPHPSSLHFVHESVFPSPEAKLSAWNLFCCGVEPGDQRANRAGGQLVQNSKRDLKLTTEVKGTDWKECKRTGTEGEKAGREMSRWGAVLVWRSRRTEADRPVFHNARGKIEIQREEASSPAYCSADPLTDIPILVICCVLACPYGPRSLTPRQTSQS